MTIKVTIEGIEFEVTSAAEAAALYRELRPSAIPTPPPHVVKPAAVMSRGRPKKQLPLPRKSTAGSLEATSVKAAITFLRALEHAPGSRLDSNDVMQALSIRKPKAMGSWFGRINGALTYAGIDRSEVYEDVRTSEGRVWTAKKDLPQALQVLESTDAAR